MDLNIPILFINCPCIPGRTCHLVLTMDPPLVQARLNKEEREGTPLAYIALRSTPVYHTLPLGPLSL